MPAWPVKTKEVDMKQEAPEKMKVALCAAGEIYGGVEEWVCTFVRTIKTEDLSIEPVVILFYDGPLAKRLRDEGVSVFIPGGRKYDLRSFSRIKKFLQKEAVEIVHTHGYLATVLCARSAHQLGLRVIKTEHSIIEPPPARGNILRHLRMHLNHCLDRFVTRRYCSTVVYVSRFAREHIHGSYKKTLSATVIPNGIVFQEPDPAFETDFNPHHYSIGIVGRLSEVKGHRYLFAAIAEIVTEKKVSKRIHLHVFGDGPLKDELWSLCGQLGIHDYVTFHGFRNHIYQYIARLDLFVMPSIFESMPYALLEAMYAARPVIVSRVGGMREVVEDGIDGLFCEARDSQSLKEQIVTLINDPSLSKRLGSAAHEKITRSYSIHTMIDSYLDVYRGEGYI
jgi:glycosyltransferase involved in cell wall biosynthesis